MGKVKKAIRALKKEEKAAKEEVGGEDSIHKAMLNLNQNMSAQEQRTSIPFAEFLNELVVNPKSVMRNIFQVPQSSKEKCYRGGFSACNKRQIVSDPDFHFIAALSRRAPRKVLHIHYGVDQIPAER